MRDFRYIFAELVVIIFLIASISCTFAKERTFSGKVIDFETKEPIEGAVVVAYWFESRSTIAGESSRFKDLKETLTDKNGEWSIVGDIGRSYDPFPGLSFITGIHYTRHPQFIIFKPGYESLGTIWGAISYQARPYIDKKQNLEGIILYIKKKYKKKYLEIDPSTADRGSLFISMKDPETKLRNLDIPFDYPKNVIRIFPKRSVAFEKYTVVGLKRLKTREERLRALPGLVSGENADKKQRKFLGLINEERRNLGLEEY